MAVLDAVEVRHILVSAHDVCGRRMVLAEDLQLHAFIDNQHFN